MGKFKQSLKTFSILFSFIGLTMACASPQAETCPRCDQINKLRQEATGIKNLKSPEAKAKARALIVKTKKLLGTHDRESTNREDLMEFRRLVVLVADVLPLDPLTSVADVLYSEMSSKEAKNRELEYKKGLSLIGDSCKRKFLETAVKEYKCQNELAENETPDKCVQKPVFDYEKCQKNKK